MEVIEELREEDLAAVTDIYNYYVLHSTATWHTHPADGGGNARVCFTPLIKNIRHLSYKTTILFAGMCPSVHLSRVNRMMEPLRLAST